MAVCLDSYPAVHGFSDEAKRLRGEPRVEFREPEAHCIEIGLINNMPSTALEATERQFRAQLDAAAAGITVRLRFYALPDVPRTALGQRRVSGVYSDLTDLWERRLDGLIVTGAEPRAPNLKDEPYWGSLTRLLDWAENHTHSTIWSCLAAHAAVLHIDGIGRRRLPEKRCGVFDCARVSDHSLTAILPPHPRIPHSRWNDIPEDTLRTCGYSVVTRSEAGVDIFVKHRRSLLVFFQGHPEYEADTLLREYRRDIRRFLRRETDSYPSMPLGYFDEDTVHAMTALRKRALSDRHEGLLTDFPTALVLNKVRNTWRSTAVCLYRAWLLYLCAQKDQQLKARRGQREYKRVSAMTFGSSQQARGQASEKDSDPAGKVNGLSVRNCVT